METVLLNDGNKIPVLGFGTYQIPADGTAYYLVSQALKTGIRQIDTAVSYFNEQEVGQAVADSGIPRQDIWITSKIWLQDHTYADAKRSIELSLKKLKSDYIDLYLIHQPYGALPEVWKAMEEAKQAGKIRSIGVCNMTPTIWNNFIPQFDSMPAINQIEFNPYCQQLEMRAIMKAANVCLEAWAPLGQGNRGMFSEPVIAEPAKKYGVDPTSVILRFEYQEGAVTFVKTTKPARIKQSLEIFEFELTDGEMDLIRNLDRGHGVHSPDMKGVAQFLLNAFDVHANDHRY